MPSTKCSRSKEQITQNDRKLLLGKLAETLHLTSQNPEPLTELIIRLIEPTSFTFDELCSIQPLQAFSEGLLLPSPPINLLILSFLEKAAVDTTSVAKVASVPELVQTWISLWLTTSDTAVAEKAAGVLKQFLENGDPAGRPDPDKNLMARRLFRDEDLYRSIFDICDLATNHTSMGLTLRQKTIAQGRLLDFVVAIDNTDHPIRRSQIVSVERSHGVKDGGLLKFAFCGMHFDFSDELMVSIYIQACTKYLSRKQIPDGDQSEWPLKFLKDHGIHNRCLQYYLKSDEYSSWLVSDSALYLGAYSHNWPRDLIANRDLSTQVVQVLSNAFQNTSGPVWQSSPQIQNHLGILGKLPRILNVADAQTYLKSPPPLRFVSDSYLSANMLITLMEIFCKGRDPQEQAAARVNYLLYIHEHPSFWTNVTTAAETVALSDTAVAAMELMGAFVTASWAPLPTQKDPNALLQLPLEIELSSKYARNGVELLPNFPWEALLLHPQRSAAVLPFLIKPPQLANPVGGSQLDGAQSAEWKMATAKFDLLLNVRKSLQEIPSPSRDVQLIKLEIGERIALGPTGGAGAVGGQVGTERR